MIIAIVCEGKLLFYNLLEYKTPMDMLYYVSSAINVVGLSDTSLPMYFSGAITEDSHLIEKVDPFFFRDKIIISFYKYFRRIHTFFYFFN